MRALSTIEFIIKETSTKIKSSSSHPVGPHRLSRAENGPCSGSTKVRETDVNRVVQDVLPVFFSSIFKFTSLKGFSCCFDFTFHILEEEEENRPNLSRSLHQKKIEESLVGVRSSSSSGKGRSYHGPVKITYGYSLVKGKANHPMEDYHVAKFVQVKGQELGLFAIYDGHLGDSVPAYLQKNLFSNILKEEEFWTHPDRSILKAYEMTDQAILSHTPELGRGGSTAVTAILINGQRLWVANVGDSRAVLAKGEQVIQMTTDHEPGTERGSIENRGGFVSNMPGDVPRVNGQLAVSRAFGDKGLKSHLRSDPDIKHEDIVNNADLLILASDGLWKVMSNEEAVNLARKVKDPEAAAKQLTTEALNRDSKDDISCVVVRFKK